MEPGFPDDGIDFEHTNAARMYDYLLGGAHNFAVDRERAEQAVAAQPELVFMARANRSFVGRVVRWCLQRGVDQFLDLGSGVPTVGNVHEVARALDPTARVAYVDFEPVAVVHATDIINQAGVTDTAPTRSQRTKVPTTTTAKPAAKAEARETAFCDTNPDRCTGATPDKKSDRLEYQDDPRSDAEINSN